MLLYLPKVLARGWFHQPGPQTAMGGGVGGCPSSVLVGKAKSASLWGQCSLLRPSWGSCPVAAGASTAVSGRHFQLWGPQEELQDAVGQERQAEVQEEDLGDDQLELWGRECW